MISIFNYFFFFQKGSKKEIKPKAWLINTRIIHTYIIRTNGKPHVLVFSNDPDDASAAISIKLEV
jgi:hypothetical protein